MSVELNEPKKQVKQANQEIQQNKEEEKDVVELQKNLSLMVKRAKDEQVKWKEENDSIHPLPPFFQEEMNSRGIRRGWRGTPLFVANFNSGCGKNIVTATELRQNTGGQGLKRRNLFHVRLMPAMQNWCLHGGRWEKDFEGCSKCIHCNKCVASGNDEGWKLLQAHA